MDAEDRMRNSELPSEELDAFKTNLERATRNVFDEHNTPLTTPLPTIETIQSEAFRYIVEYADELPDESISSQLSHLQSDLQNPSSDHARSDVIRLMARATQRQECPEDIIRIVDLKFSEKYSR